MKALIDIPSELHSDTSDLVVKFAEALAAKLLKSQEKYGFSNDWMSDGWREGLAIELTKHVEKGDPLDVAAFCAFAWHHGWSVRPEFSPGMMYWLNRLVADFPWGEQSAETLEETRILAFQLRSSVMKAIGEGRSR